MQQQQRRFIGLDFGTTNSSLAVYDPGSGRVETARFRAAGDTLTEAYRSVLYIEAPQPGKRPTGLKGSNTLAGPLAIQQYLDAENKGRLIQSIKSFATSRIFSATNIFGRMYAFEELVALIVKRLVAEAEQQLGPIGKSVTVGRPVRFAGAEREEDEAFALGRIRKALEIAGFEEIRFEFEPIGAAFHYEQNLDRDELVLIGDFGGGTSDFSLIRVGPSAARDPNRILGTEGVGLAGDAFDARIIRHLVSPRLGEGTTYHSFGKDLPVPAWVFAKLERWHHLSFLKTSETLQMLQSIRVMAGEPDRINALIFLIENDLGYPLHQAVQRTKVDLSGESVSRFHFVDGDVDIDLKVPREYFEGWIASHLQSIRDCVDRLLTSTGVSPSEVDRVFLTGGTSFVPAVRAIFADRFGAVKIAGGGEFTSVANGLARCAATEHLREAAPPPFRKQTDL